MKQCLLPEISKNSEYKVTVVLKFYQVWHVRFYKDGEQIQRNITYERTK